MERPSEILMPFQDDLLTTLACIDRLSWPLTNADFSRIADLHLICKR